MEIDPATVNQASKVVKLLIGHKCVFPARNDVAFETDIRPDELGMQPAKGEVNGLLIGFHWERV